MAFKCCIAEWKTLFPANIGNVCTRRKKEWSERDYCICSHYFRILVGHMKSRYAKCICPFIIDYVWLLDVQFVVIDNNNNRIRIHHFPFYRFLFIKWLLLQWITFNIICLMLNVQCSFMQSENWYLMLGTPHWNVPIMSIHDWSWTIITESFWNWFIFEVIIMCQCFNVWMCPLVYISIRKWIGICCSDAKTITASNV